MLKRMYVDNFKCLVNFELQLDRLTLLLGENGGGKSTVFDVLRRLRSFIKGDASVDESFPTDALTRWQRVAVQRFELDVELDARQYRYVLAIEHERNRPRRRVKLETLHTGEQALYIFEDKDARLFRDNGEEGCKYPFDWSRSGIGVLQERHDNTLLTQFKHGVAKWVVLGICPVDMTARSDEESDELIEMGRNFSSWYRYISDEYQGNIWDLIAELKKVMAGFDSFSLRESGESKLLKAHFSTNGTSFDYSFHELSDGQRALVVLYTLLFGLRAQGFSLFLDEPDNWIALREIQPWLTALHDACDEGAGIEQAVLISHHPEIIDYLGPSGGLWLERPDNGPVRVGKVPPEDGDALKLSEVIARGWKR